MAGFDVLGGVRSAYGIGVRLIHRGFRVMKIRCPRDF